MSTMNKLMTTAAVLSLYAGAAFAENHTGMADTDANANAEASATVEGGSEYPMGWNSELDTRYSDIADRPVRELVGINVIDETGQDIGEIETFVIMEQNLRAVVAVGGFLGLGEHDVALSLADLNWDGERIVIPFTKEELEAMPEWDEEADFAALGEEDSFRTRAATETVTMTEGSASSDQEMTETADATDEAIEEGAAEAEQMAENAEAATENAAEEAGEEIAEAGEATEQAVEEGAAEAEQMAENAEAATENAAEEAGEEIAEAGEATEQAVEEGAAEAEQMAENAEAATENAAEEAGQEVAEAAEATEQAVEEGATATEQMAENAATSVGNWFDEVQAEFGEMFNANVTELEGMDVATPNGDVIGEIDEVAMMNDAPVAIVGIGGFLGLGEHNVALELTQLSWNGEQFVVDGYTEEELRNMPEFDEENVDYLEDGTTLSDRANM